MFCTEEQITKAANFNESYQKSLELGYNGFDIVVNLEEDNACNLPLVFGTTPDINHLYVAFLQKCL